MQAGYFSTAWREIRSTPHWAGKMFLLALVMCIPVFGLIVVYGYFYGWTRDIAWGIQEPMPSHIFGNEDGKLYSRGFFILVLVVVCACIPEVINAIGDVVSGAGAATSSVGYYYGSPNYGSLVIFGILGGLISLIGFAASLFITFFQWVGSVRISIYGRISAGFQVKKMWAMLRKDTRGILRIFGMSLLVSLIVGIIVGIVIVVVAGIAVFTAIGTIMGISGGSSSSDYAHLLWYALGAGGVSLFALLVLVVVFYLALVVEMWVTALIANALGHWTRQFDVPAWRGQDDPMPFELQQAAMKAAQASQQPPYPQTPPAASQQQPPYAPPVAPQYQQPYQAPPATPQHPYQPPMPQQQPYQAPPATPQHQQPYQQQPYPQTPPTAPAPQEAPLTPTPAPESAPVPPAAGTVSQEPAATAPAEASQAAPAPENVPQAVSAPEQAPAAPEGTPQEPPATPEGTPHAPSKKGPKKGTGI